MMESIHCEVADSAARNARSGAPLCAAMDGEWICGGIGIEVRADPGTTTAPLSVAQHWINGHIWMQRTLRCELGGKIEKVVSG